MISTSHFPLKTDIIGEMARNIAVIPSRRGRRSSRLKSEDIPAARLSRIIVLLFNTVLIKQSFSSIANKLETIFIFPFFSPTHEITYTAGYPLTIRTMNFQCTMIIDIWPGAGDTINVLNRYRTLVAHT